MNPPTLVLCKSVHHGNTRKIAQQIAEPLGAMIVDPDEIPPSSIQNMRVLGIGSGIYYARFHRSIRHWIAKLPCDAGRGCSAFIYSTSGLPFLSRLYHWPLKQALRKRGFDVLGDFACRGYDTFGPLWLVGGLNRKHPSVSDLERARSFGIKLATLLKQNPNYLADTRQRKATA